MIKSLGVIMVKIKMRKSGTKSLKITQRFEEDIGLSFLQFKNTSDAEEFFQWQSFFQEDEETIKKCTRIGALLKTAATFGACLQGITCKKGKLVIQLDFSNRQARSKFKESMAGMLIS